MGDYFVDATPRCYWGKEILLDRRHTKTPHTTYGVFLCVYAICVAFI